MDLATTDAKASQLNWPQRIFLMLNIYVVMTHIYPLVGLLVDSQFEGYAKIEFERKLSRFLPPLPLTSDGFVDGSPILLIAQVISMFFFDLLVISGISLAWARVKIGVYLLFIAVAMRNLLWAIVFGSYFSGIFAGLFMAATMFMLFGGRQWARFR